MASNDHLSKDQQRIKDRFRQDLGYWTEGLETVLRHDSEFTAHLHDVATHSQRRGSLPPKVREFVYVGVLCMPPNFDEAELRRHVRCALDHGATFEELLSLFKLMSAIGSHSFVEGAPLLVDSAGEPALDDDDRAQLEAIKEEFVEKRGYWDEEMWGDVARLDIEWFVDYLDMTNRLANDLEIEPKYVELIATAADSSLAHTFEMGLRNHLENALEFGVSVDEVVEIFEIMASMSLSTINQGVPILVEEAERHKTGE